jgi:integrase
MLLRHTALRISDVCTLRRDAVSWDDRGETWRVRVRTLKSGEHVFLPIPNDLKLALDALPLPRNAPKECGCYFWSGVTSQRSVVGIAERTLAAVFRKSGVAKAHAHRFRHTLATRLLAQGASYEQVADILGNTPEVVRKHYGKWSKGRQDNIDRLMMAHFLTGQMQVQSHFSHTRDFGAVS